MICLAVLEHDQIRSLESPQLKFPPYTEKALYVEKSLGHFYLNKKLEVKSAYVGSHRVDKRLGKTCCAGK